VNLVVHGQRICLPVTPKCQACPLRRFCPRIGLDSRFEVEPSTGRGQRSATRGGK
jgi:adenine-specific DNA glycosylase